MTDFLAKAAQLGLKCGVRLAFAPHADDPSKGWVFLHHDDNCIRMQYYIGDNFYNIVLTAKQFEALDEHQMSAVVTQVEAANLTDARLREQLKTLRTAVKSNIKGTLIG